MIDKLLLFPYWLSLKVRHLLYDKGVKKVSEAEVPTICIGNVTVGGTGKTPHTEMLLRTLLADNELGRKSIAVLSRGYKRKLKGFQQVVLNGSASEYGDEPMQIKRKFPMVTVAVDGSRIEGCDFLVHPEKLQTEKAGKKCKFKEFLPTEVIILDDAFQHRALKPTLSIVLIDHNRPTFKDHLLPIGRLRDLPERVGRADVLIITKCPYDMNSWQKCTWADNLGLKNFNAKECYGITPDGRKQYIFFTSIAYDTPEAIFPEGDPRYIHSKRMILFSGIANDTPMARWLSGDYNIVKRFRFSDHHQFTKGNIASISSAALANSTAVVMTTEKDAQRIRDCKRLSYDMKMRMFYLPIKTKFVTEEEEKIFISVVKKSLTGSDSEPQQTPREWY